jgi:hypothetical protein
MLVCYGTEDEVVLESSPLILRVPVGFTYIHGHRLPSNWLEKSVL